ncbi:MAG: hypothetical protein JXA14_12500 [Anaerolineae bacterium]|nr:hypothetical protein [Anaerolineae bacterium]
MKKLIDHLESDLQRAVGNVCQAAQEIWAKPLHRYYTDHTTKHSERIIAKLDRLTAQMMGSDTNRLSPHEIYILLAAAYLHDIGMQNERFKGGDLEKIRDEHNSISYKMIIGSCKCPQDFPSLGLLEDPDLVQTVGRVAMGHRNEDLHSPQYDDFAFRDESIRPRLLAALLRFGDALDIDHSRVIWENLKLADIPPQSRYHWFRCQYVSGVRIEDEYITIDYRLPPEKKDEYENLVVPLIGKEIKEETDRLQNIFRPVGVKPAIGTPHIRPMDLVPEMPPDVLDFAQQELQMRQTTPRREWRTYSPTSFADLVRTMREASDKSKGGSITEYRQLADIFEWCGQHGFSLDDLDIPDDNIMTRYLAAVAHLNKLIRGDDEKSMVKKMRDEIQRIRSETRQATRDRLRRPRVEKVKGCLLELDDEYAALLLCGPGKTIQQARSQVNRLTNWSLSINDKLTETLKLLRHSKEKQ